MLNTYFIEGYQNEKCRYTYRQGQQEYEKRNEQIFWIFNEVFNGFFSKIG